VISNNLRIIPIIAAFRLFWIRKSRLLRNLNSSNKSRLAKGETVEATVAS